MGWSAPMTELGSDRRLPAEAQARIARALEAEITRWTLEQLRVAEQPVDAPDEPGADRPLPDRPPA